MRNEGRFPRSRVEPSKKICVRQLTLCDSGSFVRVSRGFNLFGKATGMILSANGILVEAMADSGAEVNLVTEEWYTENLLPKQVVINTIDVQITDANGRGIPCLGYVQVEFEVESRVIEDCGMFVKHTLGGGGVVQGTKLPILLGMNVLWEVVAG